MPEASGLLPQWRQLLLFPLLTLMAACCWSRAGTVEAASPCVPRCYCSESAEGERTVRCSHLRLTAVPTGIPNDTRRLYLDYNRLAALPADAFRGLTRLAELDLSHNELALLEPGAFRGLAASLDFLDLSANRLAALNPEAFEGVRARSNLTSNPWHCDCTLQSSLADLDLNPISLTGIVCHTAEPADQGAEGKALLLSPELDLCAVAHKTTDVAMLVTMFGWFSMVITYLVYYVRANQEDARRHLEYLKSLPSRQGKSEESSTISTVV